MRRNASDVVVKSSLTTIFSYIGSLILSFSPKNQNQWISNPKYFPITNFQFQKEIPTQQTLVHSQTHNLSVELLLCSLLSHPRMTTLSYFRSSLWGGIIKNSIPQNIRGCFLRGNKLINLLFCYCEINQSIKLAHFPMSHYPQMLALSRAER